MTDTDGPFRVIGNPASRIVLASASRTRRSLLEGAGVPHIVEPSRVDEEELKTGLRAEGVSPVEMAEVLSEAKAMYVSRKHPDAMVLGADQILALGEDTFDKPVDREDALSQLQRLRGHKHELISYAVIVRGGQRIWQAVDRAKLVVRADASDAFFDAYLDAAGDDVFNGPGGYRVESLGVQLFSAIDGAHYTILGLPLLALLDYLRANGILER
ncbi:MAG: septum formation protein Maf [Alphaproteobacteria bacterium]|nr:septum formation protein Maf [Alphaproteobacteria bacterium]